MFGSRGKSAVPESSCLLLYPLDRGKKSDEWLKGCHSGHSATSHCTTFATRPAPDIFLFFFYFDDYFYFDSTFNLLLLLLSTFTFIFSFTFLKIDECLKGCNSCHSVTSHYFLHQTYFYRPTKSLLMSQMPLLPGTPFTAFHLPWKTVIFIKHIALMFAEQHFF